MKENTFDVLVLGSGEAGKYIAWSFAKEGQKTAVIEREYIGGSCPNIACLPSKNIIHSAKVASYFWRNQEFGISKDNCQIHMPQVRQRKRQMVEDLVDMHLDIFKKAGTELIQGSGKFIDKKAIEVTFPDGSTQIFHGEKIVISTGLRAKIDPIPGLLEAAPLTYIEALELDYIPPHLIVIGGGYIGLELAQAMRRFGSQVTVIERNEHLVHREDEDVSETLQEVFKEEGINILLNIHMLSIEGKSGQSVKLNLMQNGNPLVLEGTDILVATGRSANTQDVGLEIAGVEVTDKGYIKVDEHLQTTEKDIWAVGDCAGSPQFTHIAYDDYRIAKEAISGKNNRVTTGRQVPFCMFTDPEFAKIGLSESEARAKQIPYRLAKIPMSSVLRTRTLSETNGFMKALIEMESDRILGFTVVGVGAGELIAPVQVAMLAGLPYTILRDAIFTHPTLVEGLIPLFSNIPLICAKR